MNIFLTGCTGFLGKSLLRSLLNNAEYRKYNFYVLCRDPINLDLEISFLLKKLKAKIIVGDLEKMTFPKVSIDIIFHAAADTNKQAFKSPSKLFRTVSISTERILYLTKISNCKKLIFVSSGAVYGALNESQILSEKNCLSQFNLNACSDYYGLAKAFQENYFSTNFKNTYNLRLFSFASPDFKKSHSAIFSFFKSSLESKKITLNSDGLSKRTYLSSRGLSHYLLSFIFKNDIPPGTYNIGGTEVISILEIAKKIAILTKSELIFDKEIKENNKVLRRNYVPCMKKTHEYLRPWAESIDQIIQDYYTKIINFEDKDQFLCQKEFLKEWSLNIPKKKKYVIDIDGIIGTLIDDNDYSKSKPLLDNIKGINKLYDEGNEIILFTARGYESGIDWSKLTKERFKDWGLKYHLLKFGKPSADFYIDDKLISPNFLSE